MSYDHLKNVFTAYQLSDYMGAPSLRRWLVAAIKSWQTTQPGEWCPYRWGHPDNALAAMHTDRGVLTVYERSDR